MQKEEAREKYNWTKLKKNHHYSKREEHEENWRVNNPKD